MSCSASRAGFATGGYDGEDILQIDAGREAIVVGIEYRLGLFGFLAGSKLKEQGDLNVGLLMEEEVLDRVWHFALQWVREHISKFAGDPSRVVIGGESAGAGSILNHLTANDGQTSPPLFHGAMPNSMYLPLIYPYNDTMPEIR
ncbi:hypothetical protein D9758_016890 [Tetrapyrgos nigripes]|uniref:Carboxylesterase type B domain-containing protein n=1 Tax=Tetrapyrgos nigripes TaxID=182062 RepID=A0A8H5C3U3_9AGAR|nr:hypothetical protein D9758_016890 [Tetrapyrgos nigripes]